MGPGGAGEGYGRKMKHRSKAASHGGLGHTYLSFSSDEVLQVWEKRRLKDNSTALLIFLLQGYPILTQLCSHKCVQLRRAPIWLHNSTGCLIGSASRSATHVRQLRRHSLPCYPPRNVSGAESHRNELMAWAMRSLQLRPRVEY